MHRTAGLLFIASVVLLMGSNVIPWAGAQESSTPPPSETSSHKELRLVQAVMCEDIRDNKPWNQSVAFPLSAGEIFCFAYFDPVPDSTYIYQNWFFKDRLSARVKLSLKPPRWATYSRIYLRAGDRGPWRVEITDQEGNVLDVLRFSVVD